MHYNRKYTKYTSLATPTELLRVSMAVEPFRFTYNILTVFPGTAQIDQLGTMQRQNCTVAGHGEIHLSNGLFILKY